MSRRLQILMSANALVCAFLLAGSAYLVVYDQPRDQARLAEADEGIQRARVAIVVAERDEQRRVHALGETRRRLDAQLEATEEALVQTQAAVRLEQLTRRVGELGALDDRITAVLAQSAAEKREARRLRIEAKARRALADRMIAPHESPFVSLCDEVSRMTQLADLIAARHPGVVAGPSMGTDLRGHVLSVDRAHKIVEIELATAQGVRPGMLFSVYRGETYVATVKILTVSNGRATARIDPAMTRGKVAVGDTAAKRVY